MGVAGAWDGVQPTSVLPLCDWCQEFFVRNHRPPSIALDISNHIYQVSTEKNSQHEGIEHMQLLRRLFGFLALGCSLVCVFDGPLTMEKRRRAGSAHSHIVRNANPMVSYAERVAMALNIAVIQAAAEAEAQCAALQVNKHVDVVFTSDADILANGATRILRYDTWGAGRSQSASARVVKYYELGENEAPVFAMEAMLLGNDWAEGVKGIGNTIARAVSQNRTGFAARLVQLSSTNNCDDEIARWRADLAKELSTNKHQWLNRKCNCSIPGDFPDMKVFNTLFRPVVLPNSTCASQLAHRRDQGQPDYKRMLAKLGTLWFQQSPHPRLKEQSSTKPHELVTKKQMLSFQNAVAPVVVVLLLARDAPELKGLVFKTLNNARTVEVTASSEWTGLEGCHLEPTFLNGARVPSYLLNDKRNVVYAQKPAPRALRNNSSLDDFWRVREGDAHAGASPARASRSQTCPATIQSTPSKLTTAFDTQPTNPISTNIGGPVQVLKSRRPLNAVDPAVSNKRMVPSAANHSMKMRTATRSRSKLIASSKDTRMESYFKPVASRHARMSQYSAHPATKPTRINKSTGAPADLQPRLPVAIDLAHTEPVGRRRLSIISDGDTDTEHAAHTDVETDADTDEDERETENVDSGALYGARSPYPPYRGGPAVA